MERENHEEALENVLLDEIHLRREILGYLKYGDGKKRLQELMSSLKGVMQERLQLYKQCMDIKILKQSCLFLYEQLAALKDEMQKEHRRQKGIKQFPEEFFAPILEEKKSKKPVLTMDRSPSDNADLLNLLRKES